MKDKSGDGALDTIVSDRAKPRTAKEDGVAGSIRSASDEQDETRDKIVVLMYDALAGDSNAREWISGAVWERGSDGSW